MAGTKTEISIVGHLTIDEIVYPTGEKRIAPGGSSFYASVTARLLDSTVKMYSRIGSDYPREYIGFLEKIGIDLSGVSVDEDSKTTRYRIEYVGDERNMYLLSRCSKIDLPDILDSELVYLGPVALEIDEHQIKNLSLNHKCVLDPQGLLRSTDDKGRVRLEKKLELGILKNLWILRLSEDEGRILTDLDDVLKICSNLGKLGIEYVVLSMGSRGTVIHSSRKSIYVPPYRDVNVVDTTGAGDVLGSAFSIMLHRSNDLEWSSSIAVSAASIAIEDYCVDALISGEFMKRLIERAEKINETIVRI